MAKTINHTVLSPTLALTECTDGFWLYDKTRGMNLAMRAKTAQDAFVEALEYYQVRLRQVESEYKALNTKVQSFVAEFVEDEEND